MLDSPLRQISYGFWPYGEGNSVEADDQLRRLAPGAPLFDSYLGHSGREFWVACLQATDLDDRLPQEAAQANASDNLLNLGSHRCSHTTIVVRMPVGLSHTPIDDGGSGRIAPF